MPELPEVEHARRALARWAELGPLVGFELADPALLVEGEARPAAGGRTARVVRRGKHLGWQVGQDAWILHFRMTGRLVEGARDARARWLRADGAVMAFVDPRRLGEVRRLPAAALDDALDALPLGPEPWPEPRDGAWWAARFAGARGPLKPVLMDQARVAGLGNIAGSEICFRARLAPDRPVQALEAAEWARVAEAVPAYVNFTLAAMESGPVRYVNEGGDNPFLVYDRAGQPCPRCGRPILRTVQRGRSTYACAACQAPTGS